FRRTDGTIRPYVAGEPAPELKPWDPDEFPNSTRICRETFVVGSGATPLAAQSEELMRAYVEAFRKVIENIDEIKSMDFELPSETRDVIEFDASAGAASEPVMLPV